jgi:hypothetical protein
MRTKTAGSWLKRNTTAGPKQFVRKRGEQTQAQPFVPTCAEFFRVFRGPQHQLVDYEQIRP